ncbi:MAG: PhnD/SsuA/transferrin family substrate-binding protein [Chromatiaceae bacterium]|nr:PhnD/SsuA/transferrin family substrate-binding protein [Chromatiaceae bacterium]
MAAMAATQTPWGLARADERTDALRIGLTPVFLDDQVAFLSDWRLYLEARLLHPVRFVQRGTYREIMDLLRTDRLDYAWVCGYPYVRQAADLQLLAVPLFEGKPLYRSYLIVLASDTVTRSILDLRGKVFAFSDPDSNSGWLYPNYALVQLQERPKAFFARTFFTWAHRKVLEAVAAGLAQGGAVDGYVWETVQRLQPQLTGQTRIVVKSPEFGFPPLVARRGAEPAPLLAMRQVLLEMGRDADGAALLRRLNLDGFVAGEEALFEGIAHMVKAVDAASHAAAS